MGVSGYNRTGISRFWEHVGELQIFEFMKKFRREHTISVGVLDVHCLESVECSSGYHLDVNWLLSERFGSRWRSVLVFEYKDEVWGHEGTEA